MLHRSGAYRTLPLLLCAGALLLAACSKSEAPKPKSDAPAPVTKAPGEPEVPLAPRKSVDYMAGLKNFKDESKAVTREELERSAKQVVQSAEATKAAAASKVEPPKAVETKAPAPAPAPAPVIQTPPPAPVAAPRPAPAEDVVAKAPPTAAAPAPSTAVTPISRAAPEFPREAVRSGVDTGNVRARLTIDASGNVANVQIIEARPARIFDRSVRETLSKWKFNAGADGRVYDTEVEFKR